jgi:hypothetical protein
MNRQLACGLEGQAVSVALADGSRIDDAALVSVGRGTSGTLWLHWNGADLFVSLADVIDVWPPDQARGWS